MEDSGGDMIGDPDTAYSGPQLDLSEPLAQQAAAGGHQQWGDGAELTDSCFYRRGGANVIVKTDASWIISNTTILFIFRRKKWLLSVLIL